jgi:hypothetical protein
MAETIGVLTPSAPDRATEEPMTATEDLIPMREATYQRWLQERESNPIRRDFYTAQEYETFYRAYNEGWMSCWGDYRDIILASQKKEEQ